MIYLYISRAKDIMNAVEFRQHVEHITGAGFTAVLMNLGHELGLFDIMMDQNEPLTSGDLADLAGMKERYVREWLHGMTYGKIVSYSHENQSFHIDESHHGAIRAESSFAAGIRVYAARTEDVKKCFLKDGPYGFVDTDQESFIKWFGGWRSVVGKEFIEDGIIPILKDTGILSTLDSGVAVLDACCGSGELTGVLAKRFPKSSFTGLDIGETSIAVAKQKASLDTLDNLRFSVGDVQNLPEDMAGENDVVWMFDALHDLPDPHKALSGIYKVMKPGGRLIVFDYRKDSKLEDNIEDLRISMLYMSSVFNCIPWSMSSEPRAGSGTCWGRDNISTALGLNFNVDKVNKISHITDLFVCTKK